MPEHANDVRNDVHDEHHDAGSDEAGEALLTVADAARRLGVGRSKMTQLIASGELPVVGRDPLDKRVRLIRERDVEALLKRSAKKDAA